LQWVCAFEKAAQNNPLEQQAERYALHDMGRKLLQ
jgi:hypothetical protein